MLNITSNDVKLNPFPHVVKQGILPDELYKRLKEDFPSSNLFEKQNNTSSGQGSRAGRGTGFDIYRGDEEYDRLLSSSSAWSELDSFVNSIQFVEKFLSVFGNYLSEIGCSINIDPNNYDRNNIEGRHVLRNKSSLKERIRNYLPSKSSNIMDYCGLFTRLDIERSLDGYAKPPHCDRSNRLASLIIYFTDLEGSGIEGGELNIYNHKKMKKIEEYERHPSPSDVDVVSTLSPKENLGVFFRAQTIATTA